MLNYFSAEARTARKARRAVDEANLHWITKGDTEGAVRIEDEQGVWWRLRDGRIVTIHAIERARKL